MSSVLQGTVTAESQFSGCLQNACPGYGLEVLEISLFSTFNIYRVFLSDRALLLHWRYA